MWKAQGTRTMEYYVTDPKSRKVQSPEGAWGGEGQRTGPALLGRRHAAASTRRIRTAAAATFGDR